MEKDILDTILANHQIKTVFQPIISLQDGKVLAYEALSRFWYERETIAPLDLFDVAKLYNRESDLEILCLNKALETAQGHHFMSHPYNKKLFINISPCLFSEEVIDPKFTTDYLNAYNLSPSSVVFEITERNDIDNIESFKEMVELYKRQQFLIAIDDAGAEYSGLNLISEINPNFIKLDMRLIRNIDTDYIKSALVKSMVEFSNISNAKIIAEGVETFEEFETLIHLGVHYAQGYFIQRPDSIISAIDSSTLEAIKLAQITLNEMDRKDFYYHSIKQLTTPSDTIEPNKPISDAYDKINKDPDGSGLTVLENGIPIGIITKENLALKLSGPYGYTLYQDKPVHSIMDTDFLSFESDAPLNIVSTSAMDRSQERLYDFIVITENNRFIGTVTIKNMFQKAIDMKVMTAQQQNPLTGLPGNTLIQHKLSEIIDKEDYYSVAYLDVDYFKAFNDSYGFEKGDAVIKLLADILTEFIPTRQFIGHIGGDDFILIFDSLVTEEDFNEIKLLFEKAVLNFYSKEDIANNYVTSINRKGNIEKTPLIGLTIVTLSNTEKKFNNVIEISEVLAQLKSEAKRRKVTRFHSERI